MKIWLLALISFILLGLLAFSSTEKIQKPHKITTSKEEKIIIEDHTTTIIATKQRMQSPLSPQAPPEKRQESPKTKESKKINTYKNISVEEAKLHHQPRPSILAISAIEMTQHSHLSVGDRLVLPNIEGMDYEVIVSYIRANNDGSKSITGSFKDEGISYTTTMTQSSSQSFISLATPQGAYEIETLQGIGYVYRTHDIRKHLHPSPKNDGIILNLPHTSDTIN